MPGVTGQGAGEGVGADQRADGKTKVYGNPDPAFTYQLTVGTLVGSDAFTGALTRDAGEDVGNHAITQGTLALSPNYALSFVGADLSITQRPVEVTANPQTKVYGDADPALTYHITSGTLAFSDALQRRPQPGRGRARVRQPLRHHAGHARPRRQLRPDVRRRRLWRSRRGRSRSRPMPRPRSTATPTRR